MKLLGRIKNRGIAMTEYLIILAIVAIAAIAIVGLFGKQIKKVFTRSTGAMGGETIGADAAIVSDSKSATVRDDMSKFDKSASKGENK